MITTIDDVYDILYGSDDILDMVYDILLYDDIYDWVKGQSPYTPSTKEVI